MHACPPVCIYNNISFYVCFIHLICIGKLIMCGKIESLLASKE